MRIVTRGAVKGPELPVELICFRCDSRLLVEETDLRPGIYTESVDSYGDTQTRGVYVVCPVCEEAGSEHVQLRLPTASQALIHRVHHNSLS